MTPTPILSLNTCLVRPMHESDAEQIDNLSQNPKICRWMGDRFPYSTCIDETRDWIAKSSSASPILNYAVCKPDAPDVLVGTIGLKARDDIYRRTVDLGYWLGEPYWGLGIGTELVTAFTDWVLDNNNPQFDNVLRIEAWVFADNGPSARVLEKAGFLLEGRRRQGVEKSGVVMDNLMYGKVRNPGP